MADIHAAGAIMYRLDNGVPKYLILRSAHHGEWGPPKGRADGGESDVETALREICEETGFNRAKFTPGFRETLSYMINKKGRRLTKEVVFFLSEMPAQDAKISEEHNAAHLAAIDEVNAMVVHGDLKRVFQKAHAFLTKK